MAVTYNKPGYKYRWVRAEMPTQIPKAVRTAGEAAIIDWIKAKAILEELNPPDYSFWNRPAFVSWLHELLVENHPIALAALEVGWIPSLALLQENCHFVLEVVNGKACLQFKAFPNPLTSNPRLQLTLDENISELVKIAEATKANSSQEWSRKEELMNAIQAQLNTAPNPEATEKLLDLWYKLWKILGGEADYQQKVIQGFLLKKDLYEPGLIRKKGDFVLGVFTPPVDIKVRQEFTILSLISCGNLVDRNELDTKPNSMFVKSAI